VFYSNRSTNGVNSLIRKASSKNALGVEYTFGKTSVSKRFDALACEKNISATVVLSIISSSAESREPLLQNILPISPTIILLGSGGHLQCLAAMMGYMGSDRLGTTPAGARDRHGHFKGTKGPSSVDGELPKQLKKIECPVRYLFMQNLDVVGWTANRSDPRRPTRR
jgi:hypothetical protein